jgi:hypothetical protein
MSIRFPSMVNAEKRHLARSSDGWNDGKVTGHRASQGQEIEPKGDGSDGSDG